MILNSQLWNIHQLLLNDYFHLIIQCNCRVTNITTKRHTKSHQWWKTEGCQCRLYATEVLWRKGDCVCLRALMHMYVTETEPPRNIWNYNRIRLLGLKHWLQKTEFLEIFKYLFSGINLKSFLYFSWLTWKKKMMFSVPRGD